MPLWAIDWQSHMRFILWPFLIRSNLGLPCRIQQNTFMKQSPRVHLQHCHTLTRHVLLRLDIFLSNFILQGSTETTRLRLGARASQADLTAVNGNVVTTTVADGNVTDRDETFCGVTSHQSWRRIVLLIIAITVHNIPGGLHPANHYYITKI